MPADIEKRKIAAALRRWMSFQHLTSEEQQLVDLARQRNAVEQFARCHEGSPS